MISFSVLMLSFGVSTDAFAASICKGLTTPKPSTAKALYMALIFSLTEVGCLYIGYLLGHSASHIITQVDHWIAFVVLVGLGLKMMFFHSNNATSPSVLPTNYTVSSCILTAIGTSIDSIAIGISTAFIDIQWTSFIIATGLITFSLSFIGSRFIAQALGIKLGHYAEKIGGFILIGIGIDILRRHLGLG